MKSLKPSLLLITTDQHNAFVLGCAGNPVVKTPHLDRLASGGVSFSAAYTQTPVCTPARTTIFTGQYAWHHGVVYNININEGKADAPHWTGLPADAAAFPESLAGAGYETAFFGKLHTVQSGDKNFGFQTLKLAEGKGQFISYGGEPDDYRQYLRSKGYSDADWRTWELPEYSKNGCVTSPLPAEDYIDTWTATEAIAYLDRVAEPFFCWVSFSGPHTPWDPPRPYDRMYDREMIPMPARRKGELEEKNPDWVDLLARTVPAMPRGSVDAGAPGGVERAYNRFSDRRIRRMLAAYYGQVTLIDEQVGRILGSLERRGLLDGTLVIFTADHGDYLGNNWAFYKYGAFYDSLARIPLIARWPGGGVTRSRGRDELVSLIDVAPTFLDAAGVSAAHPTDGCSLLPLLRGEKPEWRRELLLDAGKVRALLTREWKYMRWQSGFQELYHRPQDPHDLHNLAMKSEAMGPKEECRLRFEKALDAQRRV